MNLLDLWRDRYRREYLWTIMSVGLLSTWFSKGATAFTHDASWWWKALDIIGALASLAMAVVTVQESLVRCVSCREGIRVREKFVTDDRNRKAHVRCALKEPS